MVNCNIRKNWKKDSCKRKIGEAEFKVIIPKRDNSGNIIRENILRRYVSKMNNIFGGTTIIPKTTGCYLDNKEWACDKSFTIIGIRDFENPYTKPSMKKFDMKQREKKLKNDYMKVQALARKMSKEIGQDTILVEHVELRDASMVKRKKSWKKQISPSKIGYKEIFSDE